MALDKDQLTHPRKRRAIYVGGVMIPVYSFWFGGGGAITTATEGPNHEAQETPEQETGEQASAPTTGSAAAGGDASAAATSV
jgi:hypothetical protein